jgi:hypothetical protein
MKPSYSNMRVAYKPYTWLDKFPLSEFLPVEMRPFFRVNNIYIFLNFATNRKNVAVEQINLLDMNQKLIHNVLFAVMGAKGWQATLLSVKEADFLRQNPILSASKNYSVLGLCSYLVLSTNMQPSDIVPWVSSGPLSILNFLCLLMSGSCYFIVAHPYFQGLFLSWL